MEKTVCIILGAVVIGYALANAQKATEIRKTDCDSLKAKYAGKNNLALMLLALLGIAVVLTGIYS